MIACVEGGFHSDGVSLQWMTTNGEHPEIRKAFEERRLVRMEFADEAMAEANQTPPRFEPGYRLPGEEDLAICMIGCNMWNRLARATVLRSRFFPLRNSDRGYVRVLRRTRRENGIWIAAETFARADEAVICDDWETLSLLADDASSFTPLDNGLVEPSEISKANRVRVLLRQGLSRRKTGANERRFFDRLVTRERWCAFGDDAFARWVAWIDRFEADVRSRVGPEEIPPVDSPASARALLSRNAILELTTAQTETDFRDETRARLLAMDAENDGETTFREAYAETKEL